MKNILSLSVLATLFSLTVGAATDSNNADTVLYHNATLINPATEQQLNDGWLLVQQGRIVQIGQLSDGQPSDQIINATRRMDFKIINALGS